MEKIRVGHDGSGSASAWYLEEVVLNSAKRGEHIIFPCHAWIASDEGDGTLIKELHPREQGKLAGIAFLNVKCKAQND